jgi:hypothetical protein
MKLRIVSTLVLVLVLSAGSAWAIPLGDNITISDGVYSSTNAWYTDREDQEVEPNCIIDQAWDLEGMFLNGSTLNIVGGYNFATGKDGYTTGDIFFDTDFDAVYGKNNTGSGGGYGVVTDTFGYDYALRLDFTNYSYDFYQLTEASTLAVYYGQNDESNPWRYIAGGEQLEGGTFEYSTGLSDGDVNLLGGSHNLISFVVPEELRGGFIAHLTQGCGNDNLMGKATSVPDASLMWLLSPALIALGVVGRRGRS